ncbi:MAG: glycoside hydrolase family 28 protein [Verrucomicrobiota bacterium]|jgi:polygalacturonase
MIFCRHSNEVGNQTRSRRFSSAMVVTALSIGFGLLVPTRLAAQTSPGDWSRVTNILSRIIPPAFPAQDFVITSYGAVGDGSTDCTAAFSSAIAACNGAGGGRVVVPAGTFLTGAIHLLSNVNLYVAQGGKILFSINTTAFLPVVFSRYQGIELMNYSPFIYAFGQTNIAITGPGTIDGQAQNSVWYNWKNLLTADEQLLWNMASTNMPVAQRIFGSGHYLRPTFIQPVRCQNVLIDSVTILNSPMWTVTPLYCTNVTIRGVTVNNSSTSPNTDSCDPDSCTDVLIKNSSFSDGDDCIAIKSGRDQDGLRVNIPSRNIVIQNCVFADGHGGVTLGSEESGGVTNVFAENCAFNSTSLQYVFRFKNNTARGGYIANIYFRNCMTKTVSKTGIHMTMQYTSSSPADTGTNTPVIRNIDIRDCAFANVAQAVYLQGLNSANRITDVTVANCRFLNTSQANSFSNTNRISFINNKGGGF